MLEVDLLAGTDYKSASAEHFQLSTFNFQLSKRFIVIALFLGLSRIALSQGIRDSVFILKQVDVSANRLFNKETAGMTETKIDSSIIIEKINLSLSELLSGNTPVFIKSQGRGAMASASFRGAAASHTQVTWNGININSPMRGMVDFSLIPVYVVDELNLKHGAASIADNSGGLGGSINISNNADWDNRLTIKGMQGVGSFSTFDEFISIALGNTKIQSKTRLYHNYSKNDYTFINRLIADIDPETGVFIYPLDTNSNADYKRYGLLQEFYWRPKENNTVSVKWWAQKSDRSIPTVATNEGEKDVISNKQYDVDNNLVADWKRYGTHSKLSLSSAFTSKKFDYFFKYFINSKGFQPVTYSESRQKSSLNKIAYDYNISPIFSVSGNLNVDYHSVSSHDSVTKYGYEKERFDFSLFLAGRAALGERINLNLMLRQDRFGTQYTPVTPFFGFDIRILKDAEWIAKGSIARNYHYPSLNDLYWQPTGNPNLKPERGISLDLGTEYLLKTQNHEFKAGVAYFRNDIDDWIMWRPNRDGLASDRLFSPQNVKNVLSRGFEVSLNSLGTLGKISYNLFCSYSYTKATNNGDPFVEGDESIGKQLAFLPVHSGNMFTSLSYCGFTTSWQFDTFGECFTTSSNDPSGRWRIPSYFMNDLSIGKSIDFNRFGVNINFKIYNLFNEVYHTMFFRPMPQRNYYLILNFTMKS